jgi:hypothetical protein
MEVIIVGCGVPGSPVGLARANVYKIRSAMSDDLPAIIGLIDSAAAWLQRDSDQWARPWPDRKARGARVLDGLAATRQKARQSYNLFHELAHSELPWSSLVATVVLRNDRNDLLWGTKQPAFAENFTPFSVFRSYGKEDGTSDPNVEFGLSYFFGAPPTTFSSWQGTDSPEPAAGNRSERCGASTGTIRDHNQANSDLWANERAAYISRLIVARGHAGRGYSEVFLSLKINQDYAAVLADAFKGIMIAAILVTSIVMGIMARVTIIVACAVAVIATIMSHRHRHEPADGFLLLKTVNMNPWRVAVGL